MAEEKAKVSEEILQEEAVEQAAEEQEPAKEEKKAEKASAKVLKKKTKEDKEKEALKAKVEELTDLRVRQLAEFENFRNRSEKEKAEMFETGARSVLEKLLPVVDNFERGLEALPKEETTPFADGIKMIYRQLQSELENMGVKPIEAVGQPFDPALHNAVMQMESDTYESGVVAQEMMKGYTYKEKVIRHSMVAVVP